MIYVTDIINYKRTVPELEELILFLVCVAGKHAQTTAAQLDKFLRENESISPFQVIRNIRLLENIPPLCNGTLEEKLKKFGFGCYNRLARGLTELAFSNLNLTQCTKEELMNIHGIGRKSASCFLAWTRENVRVAMLDTHILKFLKVQQDSFLQVKNWNHDVRGEKIAQKFKLVNIPKSTPPSKLYDELESIYLDICDYRGLNPTELDLEIWKSYAKH